MPRFTMNLKPTKYKIIVSLFVLIIVHIFISSVLGCMGSSGFCFYLPGIISDLISPFVGIAIIGFFVIYIIWSLFEKV
jgi:hypothetical protein